MDSKQTVYTNTHVASFVQESEDIQLKPNETYVLTLDYPLGKDFKFEIGTDKKGMGTYELIGQICAFYHEVYKDEEKYGIWGHDIGDLYIESINVNHTKKTITLDVGS